MTATNTRSLRRLHLVPVAAIMAAVILAEPALAADTTATMGVNATVASNCAVTTTAVAFGSVNITDATADDATGTFTVTCTSGVGWAAAANVGTGTGASFAARKMTNGANLLNYSLYTESSRTTVWGDAATVDTSKVSGTGTGSSQANTIYARVPSGQTGIPVGAYADTVTVTVTY